MSRQLASDAAQSTKERGSILKVSGKIRMSRLICVILSSLLWCYVVGVRALAEQSDEFVPLERVALFAERYNGRVLFIDNVALTEVSRCEEAFCLSATSRDGKYFGPVLTRDGFTLTASAQMADLLFAAKDDRTIRLRFAAIDWDRDPVRIGFRVLKIHGKYGDYWVGDVFEVASVAVMNARVISGDKQLSVVCAATRGDSHTISYLVKNPDLANAEDIDGKTALMHAAQNGHEKTVKVLLALGANVNARTKDGKNALDFAQSSRNSSIIKMLSKAEGRR